VTEAVVHDLEGVAVDDDQREGAAGALGALDLVT